MSRDRPVKSLATDLADGDAATFSLVRSGGGGGSGGGGAVGAAPGADPYGLPPAQPQYAPLQPAMVVPGPYAAAPGEGEPPQGYYPAQAAPAPLQPAAFHALPQIPAADAYANAYAAPAAPPAYAPAAPAAPAESEDDILARRLEMLKRG